MDEEIKLYFLIRSTLNGLLCFALILTVILWLGTINVFQGILLGIGVGLFSFFISGLLDPCIKKAFPRIARFLRRHPRLKHFLLKF
jgi:type IV secretory pathway TrbD component